MAGRRVLIGTLTLVLLSLVVAGAALAATNTSVSIRGSAGAYNYSPATRYVQVGGSVTWRNTSDAPHTVTSTGGGPLDSGLISIGGTYRRTFSSTGTFRYTCTIHFNHSGRIIVLAQSAAPPDTDTDEPNPPAGGSPLVLLAVGAFATLVALLYHRRVARSRPSAPS